MKRITFLFLALVMSLRINAQDTCGDGVTWTYNAGTLTISKTGSGTGEMYNFDEYAPWITYYDDITTVVIGNGVTSIGGGAFFNYTSLTSVTVPASVTSIGQYAFYDCDGLTSVSFAAGSQLETIGSYAFSICLSLLSITIPESVTSIGNHAFSDCTTLTSITIPQMVSSIGESAFDGCTSLATVTCLATSVPDLGNNAFFGCAAGLAIYVPAGSIENYKTGWSYYTGNIQAIFPTITLNSAGMATFSAKFDAVITTDGVKAYKASVEGETITLTELTGYIPAGTGVLFYKEDGNGTIVEFAAPTTEGKADVTDNAFLPTTLANGSLAAKEAGAYALSGNLFQSFTGDAFIPNRAYLVKSSSAKEMFITFDGETTGIRKPNAVINEKSAVESYYNLAGQKVSADYKGIVIVNGKTMLKK